MWRSEHDSVRATIPRRQEGGDLRQLSRPCAGELRSCPRPAPLDLDFEREAQKGPYDDDHRQDSHTTKRRVDCHRVDDVAGNEELEPQQNGATELLPVFAVRSVEAW